MSPLELRGRWVLVTGASSGLGREMAKILARTHGAHLFIVARRQDRLTELKQELEQSAGIQVETCVADLCKLEDVDRVIQSATSGRALAGAILNAGVTHFGTYEALSWTDFRTMLDTNVIAT